MPLITTGLLPNRREGYIRCGQLKMKKLAKKVQKKKLLDGEVLDSKSGAALLDLKAVSAAQQALDIWWEFLVVSDNQDSSSDS